MHVFRNQAARIIMTVGLLVVFMSLLDPPAHSAGRDKPQFYLVSVGNGDPDNITLRAINVIEDADIVFCKEHIRNKFPILLMGKEIHDPGFGIFAVYGKKPEEARKNKRFDYDETVKQLNTITTIIRDAVARGKTVAVLDSGDPTIYGPNMWYMEAFEDLDPVIIPGVSCFNAANAALGKGVTSGKNTRSVILTASYTRKPYTGRDTIEELSRHHATMAFFTMFLDLPEVIKKLKTQYPPDTPIAIVLHAGYKEKENIIRGTLDTILDIAGDDQLPFEHMLYVGDFLENTYKQDK